MAKARRRYGLYNNDLKAVVDLSQNLLNKYETY